MSKVNNFLMALLTGAVLMPSCQKEDFEGPQNSSGYVFPNFKNPTETLIKSNLEVPAGLAYNFFGAKKSETKGSAEVNANIEGLYAEGPTFKNLYNAGGLKVFENPNVSKFSGSLTDLNTFSSNILTEFDLTKYTVDFDAISYHSKKDSLFRPNGLTIDNLVLDDGTVLSSSNSSDKIFKKSSGGGIEVYMQDSQLERITDIIQKRDRRIFAAQAPKIDKNTHAVISPKKVISINNKVIKNEFELPYDANSAKLVDFNSYPSFWEEAPYFEKIRIVENSEAGKKNFGTEFYVSDLLGDAIYKIDSKNNVSVLAKNLRYPSSVAVDSAGTVFYTSSPLTLDFAGLIDYPAALYALNPQTGESKLISEFGGNELKDYFFSERSLVVRYPNVGVCRLPVAFDVTNIFYETPKKDYFMLSNSHNGAIEVISIDK